jgi:hypothetical protein
MKMQALSAESDSERCPAAIVPAGQDLVRGSDPLDLVWGAHKQDDCLAMGKQARREAQAAMEGKAARQFILGLQ